MQFSIDIQKFTLENAIAFEECYLLSIGVYAIINNFMIFEVKTNCWVLILYRTSLITHRGRNPVIIVWV